MRRFGRRDFIGVLGGAAAGCGPRRAPAPATPSGPAPTRTFAPVHVSADREIRTVVGLRPFRPSGFVVRAEKMGEKLIVHNYGHGGGGVTLSWGTSQLAVDLASPAAPARYAVLGCGCVGLATARLIQRRGGSVTIYAKDQPPETTSNIAGAQWWPVSVYSDRERTAAFTAQFERAARVSHRHFQTMLGDHYGVRWTPNFVLAERPPPEESLFGPESRLRDLYPEYRTIAQHPFDSQVMVQFTSMMIEPPVYLRALLHDFLVAGGGLVVRELASLEQVLGLPEPVIFNCTGLGARALFHDAELTPVKGQLTVLLPQPEVDYNLMHSGGYMFPRRDGILLGGTFERGEWSLEPNLEAKQRIVEAHRRVFGAMRKV